MSIGNKLLRLTIIAILLIELVVSFSPVNAAISKRSGKQPYAWVSNTEDNGFRSGVKPLTMFEETNYILYDCSLGSYRMSKTEPQWKFTERSGILLAPSSRFIFQYNNLGSWEDLNISKVQTAFSNNIFTYTFNIDNWGKASITAQFYPKTPPKFTVAFTKTTSGDTRIIWKTTVPQAWKYFSVNNETPTDFSQDIHTKINSKVRVLNIADLQTEQNSLIVDWSDYGETFVQLKGSTISVVFPTNQNTIDPTLYDYYDSGDDGGAIIYSSEWRGQTFTVANSFVATTISLKIYRTGACGTVSVGIRATSSGLPTGSDLVTGTIAEGSINSTANGSWHNITITSIALQKGTQYAIIVRAPSGVYGGNLWWRRDTTYPSYAGGTWVTSGNWGATWSSSSFYDAMFRIYGNAYAFHLVGVLDEGTGNYEVAASRAVNVTAHYSDGMADSVFEVNGTYNYAGSGELLYFEFNTSSTRQYWIGNEEFNSTIYIFDVDWVTSTSVSGYSYNWTTNQTNYTYATTTTSGLTTYTLAFTDLSGVLTSYPYIAAKRYINGTLTTIEKRKVDAQKQVVFKLVNGARYTITVESVSTIYTFGDIETTSTITISLTIKGLEFPSEIVLAYTKVRMYADRTNNHSYINFYYEDTTENTGNVICTVYWSNGSIAYSHTQTSQSFTDTWTSADYSTSYYGEMVASHSTYGTLTYRTTFPLAYSSNPWSLAFLGSLPGGINTNVILPSFLILCAFGVFSRLNAYVGMFAGVSLAGLFVWIGWSTTISIAMIITALAFTILYALARKRRRIYE